MKSLKKLYIIEAPIDHVFDALTKEELIEQWSGSQASMNLTSDFSLWGGDIHGRNIEVTPLKIIQSWKVKAWKDYSEVSFTLSSDGKRTKLSLHQHNIPDDAFKEIDNGWDEYYLSPLKDLVEHNISES